MKVFLDFSMNFGCNSVEPYVRRKKKGPYFVCLYVCFLEGALFVFCSCVCVCVLFTSFVFRFFVAFSFLI